MTALAQVAVEPGKPAIELKDVAVVRDGNVILEDVTAHVPRGGVTAIIGPNGAGKTTLLRAMLGLMPHQGTIRYHGRSGPGRPRIGYVPQRLDFDRGVPLTVLDFLVLARQRIPVWFGVGKALRQRAAECLQRVGADPAKYLLKPLGGLSLGELQRVQLALALEGEPEIVFLDEPVAGVDVVGERLFCDMLENIQRESHLTLVMVSHDLSVVSRHASHVLCLNRRLQCSGSAPMVLSAENLSAIYGPHMGLHRHTGSTHPGHEHQHCGHDHGVIQIQGPKPGT